MSIHQRASIRIKELLYHPSKPKNKDKEASTPPTTPQRQSEPLNVMIKCPATPEYKKTSTPHTSTPENKEESTPDITIRRHSDPDTMIPFSFANIALTYTPSSDLPTHPHLCCLHRWTDNTVDYGVTPPPPVEKKEEKKVECMGLMGDRLYRPLIFCSCGVKARRPYPDAKEIHNEEIFIVNFVAKHRSLKSFSPSIKTPTEYNNGEILNMYVFTVTPTIDVILPGIKPRSGEVRYFTGLSTTTELFPVTVEDFKLMKLDGTPKGVLFGEYEKVEGVKRAYECTDARHAALYVVELWKLRETKPKKPFGEITESVQLNDMTLKILQGARTQVKELAKLKENEAKLSQEAHNRLDEYAKLKDQETILLQRALALLVSGVQRDMRQTNGCGSIPAHVVAAYKLQAECTKLRDEGMRLTAYFPLRNAEYGLERMVNMNSNPRKPVLRGAVDDLMLQRKKTWPTPEVHLPAHISDSTGLWATQFKPQNEETKLFHEALAQLALINRKGVDIKLSDNLRARVVETARLQMEHTVRYFEEVRQLRVPKVQCEQNTDMKTIPFHVVCVEAVENAKPGPLVDLTNRDAKETSSQAELRDDRMNNNPMEWLLELKDVEALPRESMLKVKNDLITKLLQHGAIEALPCKLACDEIGECVDILGLLELSDLGTESDDDELPSVSQLGMELFCEQLSEAKKAVVDMLGLLELSDLGIESECDELPSILPLNMKSGDDELSCEQAAQTKKAVADVSEVIEISSLYVGTADEDDVETPTVDIVLPEVSYLDMETSDESSIW